MLYMSVLFSINGAFSGKILEFNKKVCDGCHDKIQISINFVDAVLLLWTDMIIELTFVSWLIVSLWIIWNMPF